MNAEKRLHRAQHSSLSILSCAFSFFVININDYNDYCNQMPYGELSRQKN